MSYDALTTAGRHLLSAEAFSFADDGKEAIKDFEWSAFSFFFCVFYQKASGRRGPPPFFPRAPFFAAFLDPSIHSKAVARRIFLLCTGVLNHLKKEYFSKGGEFFPFLNPKQGLSKNET